jgi:hypothetical protein
MHGSDDATALAIAAFVIALDEHDASTDGHRGRSIAARARHPVWRKPASIQTCDGHPGCRRHGHSRNTNLVKFHSTARASAIRSVRVIGSRGGQSAHVVVFVIVSPGPIRSCCIFCRHAPARLNGQPGRSVVGPGWLQLGVSNCSFVTRTGVWVHPRVIRLSLHDDRPEGGRERLSQ